MLTASEKARSRPFFPPPSLSLSLSL
jgi:hypothetical protein